MRVFLIVSLATVLGSEAAPPLADQHGSCVDDEDCVEGYTSLLQEDVNLLKHKTGHKLHDHHHIDQMASKYRSSSSAVPSYVWSIVALAVLAVIVYWFVFRPTPAGGRDHARRSSLDLLIPMSEGEDVHTRDPDAMPEDTYNLAVSLIVRDLHFLASNPKSPNRPLRITRITFAVGLVALTVTLQVLILMGTKQYVTPQQVASIRDSYDEFEDKMYMGHTVLNANGKKRGIPGFFNATVFDTLNSDLQSDVCNIPLSQLTFLWLILVVWSITCMAQLKSGLENFLAIVVFAETKETMADALTTADDDSDEEEDDDPGECDDGIPTMIISGLTLPVKAFLSICVLLPDILTTAYILWLGSRWLVATNDFGNLISNAVALEFVLMFKCLLYVALVSDRNKRDLNHTALAPIAPKEAAGYQVYFNSLIWALLSVLWVWYYINNQGVLLDYRWDVHQVCTTWLNNQLNPDYDSGTDD